MSNISSVYIHIPFCSNICSYCDFCKMYYNKELVNRYLNELQIEINNNYKNELIKTIYIGGGTPSCLDIDELNKLFDIIKVFRLSNNCEFTIEMNINDVNKEKLELFKDNSINRISIGIQTINDKFLKLINRNHTKEEVVEKINLVKNYFNNINVDFMYAFPNETIIDLKKDLYFFKSLDIPHISIYSLILEEHTKLYIDKTKTIDESLEADMYYYIIKYLEDINYTHYEISNFCKEGYSSKHNLTYWDNEKYYGFGLGASGYIDNYRYTNTRSISNYLKGEHILEKETITMKTDMENFMIFGFRKCKGINKSDFFDRFNCNIYEIFDIINLINNNMLIDKEGYIFIPKDKLYVSNSILVNFIGGSNE